MYNLKYSNTIIINLIIVSVIPFLIWGPFFPDLITFMTSGPIQVQILEGENAISKYREVMGNTNPKEANPGTLRADFADSIDANAVHGSDSETSAEREINYFFID